MAERNRIFINYVGQSSRPTAINVAVGRLLLAFVVVWKLLSYDFENLGDWPGILFETHPHSVFLLGDAQASLYLVEMWVAVATTLLFAIGYRVALTGFVSALIIAHITALHYVPTNAGSTFLPFVYLLLFYAVYRDTDRLSYDNVKAQGARPLDDLKASLAGPGPGPADTTILRWLLIVLAAIYFFTGYSKLWRAGLVWGTAENLGLILHQEAVMCLDELPALGKVLMEQSWLRTIIAVGTLVLECGFIVAVLARLPVTPFILGLGGMHAGIDATMNIFFFDQYLIYFFFVPWDTLHARWSRDEDLTVIYDHSCHFCATSLQPFKELDVNGRIEFVPSDQVPERFADREVDYDSSMVVFRGDEMLLGYDGFRAMAQHLGLLRPIGLLMRIPFVRAPGKLIYARVARKRQCRVPDPG